MTQHQLNALIVVVAFFGGCWLITTGGLASLYRPAISNRAIYVAAAVVAAIITALAAFGVGLL